MEDPSSCPWPEAVTSVTVLHGRVSLPRKSIKLLCVRVRRFTCGGALLRFPSLPLSPCPPLATCTLLCVTGVVGGLACIWPPAAETRGRGFEAEV